MGERLYAVKSSWRGSSHRGRIRLNHPLQEKERERERARGTKRSERVKEGGGLRVKNALEGGLRSGAVTRYFLIY